MHTQVTEQTAHEKVAEYYKELGRRSRKGMLSRAQAGLLSGPTPLGYKLLRGPEGTRVVLDEAAAPLIARAFELLALPSTSLRSVHKLANGWGLEARRGKPLSLSTFQHLVANPFYAGLVRYQGELYAGMHQPIIALQLFQRVQKNLASRNTNRTPHT